VLFRPIAKQQVMKIATIRLALVIARLNSIELSNRKWRLMATRAACAPSCSSREPLSSPLDRTHPARERANEHCRGGHRRDSHCRDGHYRVANRKTPGAWGARSKI